MKNSEKRAKQLCRVGEIIGILHIFSKHVLCNIKANLDEIVKNLCLTQSHEAAKRKPFLGFLRVPRASV